MVDSKLAQLKCRWKSHSLQPRARPWRGWHKHCKDITKSYSSLFTTTVRDFLCSIQYPKNVHDCHACSFWGQDLHFCGDHESKHMKSVPQICRSYNGMKRQNNSDHMPCIYKNVPVPWVWDSLHSYEVDLESLEGNRRMFCEGRCHKKYEYRLIPQQVLGKLYRKH